MSKETKVYEITIEYSSNRDLGSLVDNQKKIYEVFQRDVQANMVKNLPHHRGDLQAELVEISEK